MRDERRCPVCRTPWGYTWRLKRRQFMASIAASLVIGAVAGVAVGVAAGISLGLVARRSQR